MANTIDLATLAVGAALGYGLKSEIKSAGTIARNALLAGIAGAAMTAAAEQAKSQTQTETESQGTQGGEKNGN